MPDARAGDADRRVAVRRFSSDHAGPVDFDIRPGEILGLVGLRGAGQEEIGRALFGSVDHAGAARIGKDSLDLTSMRHALASGVGLVARDRTAESVAGSLSIRENVFLNPGAVGPRLVFGSLAQGRDSAGGRGRAFGGPPPQPAGACDRESVGRQPAEGRGRDVGLRRNGGC